MTRDTLITTNPFLKDRLFFFETTRSTNDEARNLAEQGIVNAVVVAATQTAGRGRLTRSFLSPAGDGLYLSMVLPLLQRELSPTVYIACGVYRAIEQLIGRAPQIKWVNDLLLDAYKICGILAEVRNGAVVAGIGVNVNTPKDAFGADLPHVSSLAAQCGQSFSVEKLAGLVVEQVELVYQWAEPAVYTYYKKRLFTLGQQVSVHGQGESRQGLAVDLSPDGALLVAFAEGAPPEKILFGDVSVRGLHSNWPNH